jgi:tetratricopeptide (TPR) repeat protein
MPTSYYWLREIDRNRNNLQWFQKNEPHLYDDLQVGLDQDKERENFVPVLIETLPFLPAITTLDPWRKLIRNTVDQVDYLQTHRLQCEILNSVGYFHLLCGNRHEAGEIYDMAARFVQESDVPTDTLKTVIGYLWLLSDHQVTGLEFERIPDILTYYPDARSNELHMRLYHAIAAACNHWGHYETAIIYGTLAYKYWKSCAEREKRFMVEYGRAAHLLTIAYRQSQDHARANYYLEQASKILSQTGYIWQYSAIMYEYGMKHFHAGNYEDAIASLKIALEEVLQLDDIHRRQVVYEGLGITYSMSCDRDSLAQGHHHLQQAYDLAYEQDNRLEIARIRHSLAFNCAKQQDLETARKEISYGLRLCEDIKNREQREKMIKLYRDLTQMIDDNDPRLCL